MQRRVLVVEDEPTIAESVAARLRAEGFTVDIARDGPAGVAAAESGRPDVVVLDVMLPGMSGIHVLKELKRTDPTIPIIVVTGTDSLAIANEAVRSGATTFLRKPFDLRELDQRVAAIIANSD
jgi:DNA-binding response OmpR family regulator